ncbi:MAG: amidase family protein, partial [Kiritimatiellia bacterium]
MTADMLYDRINQLTAGERRRIFAAFSAVASVEQSLEEAQAQNKPLAGHICFIKDNFDLPGFSTSASSLFLEEVRPGPHRAGALVKRIRELGLTIAGKTHMNEFAYGLDGANPHVGDCPHPFLPGRCSGGSSSGSAWTVARELVPIAFGTDTGGSIRVPAAFCGLTGFRLPPNAWAQDGCFPLAPRFDSAGWFTRSVEEMNFFSRALLDLPEPSATPLRIVHAVPESSHLTPFLQKHFPGAARIPDFTSETAAVERVRAYTVLQSLEALNIHRDWVDSYADLYDPVVRSRILRARNWQAEEISQAEKTAEETRLFFAEMFQSADVILLPV